VLPKKGAFIDREKNRKTPQMLTVINAAINYRWHHATMVLCRDHNLILEYAGFKLSSSA
jgi:hypothetical protein